MLGIYYICSTQLYSIESIIDNRHSSSKAWKVLFFKFEINCDVGGTDFTPCDYIVLFCRVQSYKITGEKKVYLGCVLVGFNYGTLNLYR